MTLQTNESIASAILALDARIAQLGQNSILRIYDNANAQPADPDTAVPGGSVELLTFTLSAATPYPGASDGGGKAESVLAGTPYAATGLSDSTALWGRLFSPGGTTPVVDGSVGVGAGFDFQIDTTVVTVGKTFNLTGHTLEQTQGPNAT